MAGNVEFKLDSAQYNLVTAKLSGVAATVKSKSGRAALRKAANVIRDAARKNASVHDDPETSERISKNVMAQFNNRLFRRTGDIAFRIGVRGGARFRKVNAELFGNGGDKRNPGGDTWYWRLLEFGTKNIEAMPMFRPALAQNVDTATNTFANALEVEIDKCIARGGKVE